ncbi:MAG: M12 family metallo-peptidase [Ardenticatenaceae bacterium]
MRYFTLPEASCSRLISSILGWGKGVVSIWGMLLLMALLLFLAGPGPDVALADDPTGDRLFTDAGVSRDRLTEETVIRERLVNIDFSLLGGPDSQRYQGRAVGTELLLNAFEDTLFTTVLDQVKVNPSGSYTWIGHLAEHDHSQVTLVVRDGIMVGKIALPTGIYEIQYVGGEVHRIIEIDQSAFPDDVEDVILVDDEEPAVESRESSNLASVNDDGSLIDVLVLYTPAAKAGAGGTTKAIESTIELAVAETNQAYESSEVKQRLFIANMAEVEYDETGSSTTDLSRLRSSSDGFMDDIHALRNEYHADEVVLITENGGGFCGVAYLMTSINTSFHSSAFSVVARGCATGNYTFGHELGHNMGLNHDWYVNTRTSPFPHSHGYVHDEISAPWRTVMAYNSLCRDQGFYCNRLPYWSNPDVTRNGAPMGVASGTSTNCSARNTENPPCDADNAVTLDSTAATVAQFRLSETVWQGHNSNWNDPTNWSTEMVPRVMDDVTIPAAPTGGHFPTIRDDATVRNLIILDQGRLTMSAGSLQIYGNWLAQKNGTFTAADGTVIFKGHLDQRIESNPDSHFHHLQLGDGGGTQTVTLNSDLHIKGNFDLMAGIFKAGNHTIHLAGNWNDDHSTFVPNSSTLILEGTTQSMRKKASNGSSWNGDLTFYNLTVNGTHSSIINGNIIVTNDLTVHPAALLDLATNEVSVEGTVTNNGGLQQSKQVNNGSGDSTYEFLTIKNAAQSETKYYGVQITPDSEAPLGVTSVRILGNQNCTSNPTDQIIRRCFNITPTIANPATIRYWFTEAERNNVDADSIQNWAWSENEQWDKLENSLNGDYGSLDHCAPGVDPNCWYEWNGISNYWPIFAGTDIAPTGTPTSALAGHLAALSGIMKGNHVEVSWETSSELDYAGFNLYRGTTDSQFSESLLLNNQLIQAQAPDKTQGFTYEWIDYDVEEGLDHLYWLEEINTNGNAIGHTPIRIIVTLPTSVHLGELQASKATPSKISLLILFLSGLVMAIGLKVES